MKSIFNRVVMPFARYVAPDNSRQRIGLADYKKSLHDKHLICLHCDAKVHFNAGAAHKNADNNRQAQHFHTNPKQDHDPACSYGRKLAEQPRDDHLYDDTLGYRLNLNIPQISRCPDEGHQVVPFVREDRTLPDVFYAMRPVPIRDTKEFAARLKELDPERLRRSVVIWHDRFIPFNKFFMRGDQRLSALVDKLQIRPLRHPVMMYVHPEGEGWMNQTPRHEDRMNFDCEAIRHPSRGPVDIRLCLEKDVARAGITGNEPVLALCRPNLHRGKLYIDIDQVSGVANCDLIRLLDLQKKADNSVSPIPAQPWPAAGGADGPSGLSAPH